MERTGLCASAYCRCISTNLSTRSMPFMAASTGFSLLSKGLTPCRRGRFKAGVFPPQQRKRKAPLILSRVPSSLRSRARRTYAFSRRRIVATSKTPLSWGLRLAGQGLGCLLVLDGTGWRSDEWRPTDHAKSLTGRNVRSGSKADIASAPSFVR
jgi:hypothetical protein